MLNVWYTYLLINPLNYPNVGKSDQSHWVSGYSIWLFIFGSVLGCPRKLGSMGYNLLLNGIFLGGITTTDPITFDPNTSKRDIQVLQDFTHFHLAIPGL